MQKIVFGLALTAAAIAVPAQATLIFGVDEVNNLVTFKHSAPGTLLSSVMISGTPATMLAIDFRANGVLYGLGDDYRLYTINKVSGAATAVNSAAMAISGSNFGFDFNPTIDRIRVVSNLGNNYVVNPNTGTIQLVATNISYAPGDPNAGATPVATANAYTPSTFGAPGASTQLYAIESTRDVLTKQNNNGGVLTTVGALGRNFGPRDSFDIDKRGVGFVIDNTRLYQINLGTGGLTTLGMTPDTIYAIAAEVPEPATWGMMLGGFALMGSAVRRRRSGMASVTA